MVSMKQVKAKADMTRAMIQKVLDEEKIRPVELDGVEYVSEADSERIVAWRGRIEYIKAGTREAENTAKKEPHVIDVGGGRTFEVWTVKDLVLTLGMSRVSIMNLSRRYNLGILFRVDGKMQRVFIQKEITFILSRKGESGWKAARANWGTVTGDDD